MKKLLVVSGLTGSGKTQVVWQLSQQLNSRIIPADSLQVYKNWPISSNWPENHDKYELIGKYDGLKQFFTSYNFKNEVIEILKQQERPVIEGGCCFFLNYLLNSRREQFDEEQIQAADVEATKLLENCRDPQALLRQHCPSYDDSLPITDKYRLTKALRFALLTNGETYQSPFKSEDPKLLEQMDVRGFFLTEPQENISRKIYARCDQMIKAGLLKEFYEFYRCQENQKTRFTTPIGYDEFVELMKYYKTVYDGRYISQSRADKLKKEKARKFIQNFYVKSRQYAAYQRKYFRTHLEKFVWIDSRTINIPQLIKQLYDCDRDEFEKKVELNLDLKKQTSKYLGKQADPIPPPEIELLVYQTVQEFIEL